MRNSSARRYLRLAALTALVVCVGVILINLAIDPFGTFRFPNIAGVNEFKPAMQTRIRLAKAYDIRWIGPRAIVLGTSRSHVALRMTHPGWSPAATPRYNLAFDGATPEEMYYYLLHADAVQPLTQVVLGLDTWEIGDTPSIVRPDFDPRVLYTSDSPLRRFVVGASDLRLLASLDTLAASLRTIRAQTEVEPRWLAPDGQRFGPAFFHRPGEDFMTIGPASYFGAVDRQEVGFKLDNGPASPLSRSARDADMGAAATSFDYIRKIVAFCRQHEIDLRIFITPAHAHQMEISQAVGEGPKIEAGKRELVRFLAEEAAENPGRQPFPLWDFSGYSSITTETVPPAGSKQEMKYYWDSSHFKEIVGDFVLDRLFGVSSGEAPPPQDFGQVLSVDTVDRVLADIRLGHLQYRREHPDDVVAIEAMVAKARANGSDASQH
jgi:hypothetical protein